MGPAMMDEYMKFSLEAALRFKLEGNWDAFSTNLLLVGSAGVITPCHFDEQQNLFAQLSGRKRVRLFPPEAWSRLYPFPLNHPCDRQTRVKLPSTPGSCDLEDERDQWRFPQFKNCDESNMEYFVDLEPGEVLYIPQYWFHQMEALTENTSLSWWFKHQSKHKTGPIDLSKVSRVAVRRNLERLIAQSVGEGLRARDFFLALASGRIPIPPATLDAAVPMEGVIAAPLATDTPKPLAHPLEVDVASAAAVQLSPNWIELAAQSVKIASMVLPPTEAAAFIQEIAAGRFAEL